MTEEFFSFENIINTMGFGICVYDAYGFIRYYNPAFSNAYLEGSDKYKGRHFSDIRNREYRQLTCMPRMMKEREKIFIQKQLENYGSFFIDCSPSFDENGSLKYIVETIASAFKAPILPLKEGNSDTQAVDMFLSDVRMKSILETITRISNFDSTVLITGESGTGKSMLASFIHSKSKRAGKPFVTINCAAIPENLIESELFGYVPGAFTGANPKGKKGLVEIADTGTLFLDEVGLLPQNLQIKFLELIQDKVFTPIGAVKSKTVDIRIISATNLNLKKQIAEKKFREDLYYRLRVIEFNMPSLNERPDALDPLIDYFLSMYNRKYNIAKELSFQAREMLHKYTYKGNVRELQYIIERLIVTSAGNEITAADVPNTISSEISDSSDVIDTTDFDAAVNDFQKELLLKYFAKYRSSYKVAEALGMSQTKASRLMRKYGIR